MTQNTWSDAFIRQHIQKKHISVVQPELVKFFCKKVGRYTCESLMFVQQLHCWMQKEQGVVEKGKRWVYNTYEGWRLQSTRLTDYNFRQIKTRLTDLGVIETEQLNGRDHTLYYTINYQHKLVDGLFSNSTDASVGKVTDAPVSCSTDDIDSKITPKNTSKKTTDKTVIVEQKK